MSTYLPLHKGINLRADPICLSLSAHAFVLCHWAHLEQTAAQAIWSHHHSHHYNFACTVLCIFISELP